MESDNIVIKTEPYEEIQIDNVELIDTTLEWSQNDKNIKCENIELEDIFDENDKVDVTKLQLILKETNEETSKAARIKNIKDNRKDDKPMLSDVDIVTHNNFTNKKKYSCQFCEKSFERKPILDNHLIKIHKDEIDNDMDKFITSELFKCENCTFVSTIKTDITRHSTIHENQKNKPINMAERKFNCQFCEKSFDRKKILENHLLKLHRKEMGNDLHDFVTSELFKCGYCIFQTTCKTHIIRHLKTHEKKIEYKSTRKDCEFCTKSFAKKVSLDNHMLQEHKKFIESNLKQIITNKIHKCDYCEYETTQMTSLKRHINTHDIVKQGIIDKYEIYKKKNCQFCPRSYRDKRHLDDHLLKVHKKIVENHIDKFITSKIFKCKSCSYKSTQITNFKNHVRVNHGDKI